MEDVIIVGGSFSGLSAAMQLARARRRVTVLDTGLNRNRYAEHAQNIPGFDGVPPGNILGRIRQQVAAYPTVSLINAGAKFASGEPDAFVVETDKGERIDGRRVILSYGITDALPAIPGFAESWGKSVIHCPFCHGYEVAGGPWALLYSSPMSLHMPALYANWTDNLTVILDGHEIGDAERHKLQNRGVRIESGRVSAIEHSNGQLRRVRLDTGVALELAALFAHPRNRPSADLHAQLGLEMKDTPTGTMVAVGDMQATSRSGIFAAGDLATGMHSVTFAHYTGSMAAMGALHSLMQ